jgi:hypothetical protein
MTWRRWRFGASWKLAVMVSTPCAQAAANPDLIDLVGVGQHSCAKAFSPAYAQLTMQWIFGYFSALNDSGPNGMVGHSTDGEGIFGEVRLYCQRAPSDNLYWATKQTYRKMARKGK